MKRFVKWCALALNFIVLLTCLPFYTLAEGTPVPTSLPTPAESDAIRQARASTELHFGADGTFTVLLLAGMQDTQFPSMYLMRCVGAVIRDYPPDFIVLLGDQLDGASPVLRLGNGYDNVTRALAQMLQPIVASGIPFAVLFGPSDARAPVSLARQKELYEAYPNCVWNSPDFIAASDGVSSLPVYDSDGAKILLDLYFFEGSEQDATASGVVSAEQVAEYIARSEAQRTSNVNQAVPSVAFMHAALPEVYELFSRVSKADDNAVRGQGHAAQSYYRLDSERIFSGSAQQAPETSLVNNGLFDAFVQQNDVFLSISGHEHANSFIGMLEGVDLLSAPGSTFTGEPGGTMRGARLVRFTEFNVRDYETVHVSYADYLTTGGVGAIPYYLTTTTRVKNWVKVGLILLLLAALFVFLVITVFRPSKSELAQDMPADDERADALSEAKANPNEPAQDMPADDERVDALSEAKAASSEPAQDMPADDERADAPPEAK